MEKDYLAEYVIGRIRVLEAERAEIREERDWYKSILLDAKESAKAVFEQLEHHISTYDGTPYYKLDVWDKPGRPYEALKHLLWLLGVTDPGALEEEKQEEKNK